MLIKTIKNYIEKENNNYNILLDKRKERFIRLIELKAPLIIIKNEVQLLSQSFIEYIAKRIKQTIGRYLQKLLTYLL